MNIDLEQLKSLRGTSSQKAEQLVQIARGDGKTSTMLWFLERAPFGIGDVVKLMVYDAPSLPAELLDSVIDNAARAILVLKSDTPDDECSPDATN